MQILGLTMRLIILLLLIGQNAQAYILPTHLILDHMSKNCLKEQKFNGMLTEGQTQAFLKLRLDSQGLFITEKTPLDQRPAIKNEPFDIAILAKLLSCNSGIKEFEKYLTELGVDVKKVSLGLYEYEPVFIIGADPTDEKSAQVWVQKNNFLPVKQIGQNRTTRFKWIDKKFPALINTQENGLETNLALSAQDNQ